MSTVAKALGISRTTIYRGLAELDRPAGTEVERSGGRKTRIRNVERGRKKLIDKDPTLLRDLENLVDPD